VRTTSLKILGDRVLVRPDEAEKTERGIYLPEAAQERPQRGTVVAVGEGRRLKNGTLLPPDVKVGDRVMYGRYSGNEVTVDGQKLLIIGTNALFAVIDE